MSYPERLRKLCRVQYLLNNNRLDLVDRISELPDAQANPRHYLTTSPVNKKKSDTITPPTLHLPPIPNVSSIEHEQDGHLLRDLEEETPPHFYRQQSFLSMCAQ